MKSGAKKVKRSLGETTSARAKRDTSKLSMSSDQKTMLNDIITALQSLNRRKRSLTSEPVSDKRSALSEPLRAGRLAKSANRLQRKMSLENEQQPMIGKLEEAIKAAAAATNETMV
jgi:hypothetical protein